LTNTPVLHYFSQKSNNFLPFCTTSGGHNENIKFPDYVTLDSSGSDRPGRISEAEPVFFPEYVKIFFGMI
jgi:hypothetical protein